MEEKKSPIILGIDLEGINEDLIHNGINHKKDRISEIGAVMWDWKLSRPIEIIQYLIDEEDRLPISEELEKLTGISDDILADYGKRGDEISSVLDHVSECMNRADYIMAHNGEEYDKPMLDALYKRMGKEMPQKIWIDTVKDIEFPSHITGRSMIVLEHQHGFINPFPHRAITDVLAMFKIACNYNLSRMVKLAASPKVTLVASLNPPNWKNKKEVTEFNRIKSKVSKAYFRWNPEEKTWSKEIHEILVSEGKVKYDFDWYISKQ